MNSMKLVYVKFYDHFSEDEVEELDKIQPVIVEAVGWVVREDDKFLYIANWISHDNECKKSYDINGIFKPAIIELKELATHEELQIEK